jgi:PAS domain S-box-containing protein/diguanylate cyclase (GGDEF)-like protein
MSFDKALNFLIRRFCSGSIARRLTVALVVLGITATVIITAAQTYLEYQSEIKQIDERFERVRVTHGRSLAASIWSFSEIQIQLELQGLLNTPGFEYAEVKSHEGQIWTVGNKSSANAVVFTSSLVYPNKNTRHDVGTLTVVAGKNEIIDLIKLHAFESLLYFGTWIFFLAGFLFLVFRQLVTRHLDALVKYTSSISFESEGAPLILARNQSATGSEDELDLVTSSINSMRTQLTNSITGLQTSEQRFRAFFQSSSIAAIIAIDSDGNLILWNPGAEQTFGYSKEEILGKPLLQLIPDRYKEAHQRGLQKALETSEYSVIGKTVELSGVRKDGSEFPLELSLGVWSSEGKTQFSAIIKDISDRKKAQQEARESTALVGVLHAIAVAANEADTVEEALRACLNNVCTYSGWPVGHVYLCDPKNPEKLVSSDIWHMTDEERLNDFKEGTRQFDFMSGEGLPGVVLETKEPSWIIDLQSSDNFPRADLASEAGLVAGFALPVLAGSEVKGVLEFFSEENSDPDPSLFYTLIHIGTQLGRVIERRDAEESQRKLSMAVEQSSASVIITDTEGVIEYVNSTFCDVTGYSSEEAVGLKPSIIKSGYHSQELYEELWGTITSGRQWRGELHNKRKNGDLFWEDVSISPIKDDEGKISHFLAVKEDISIRKQYEDQLIHQANYDALTGLPNRLLAVDRLTQAITAASRDERNVAVLFAVLDDINKVNDTLGHEAVDELLKKAGTSLAHVVGESDTVAHFGSGEFVIILPGLEKSIFAELMARELMAVFDEPIHLKDSEISIGMRIGLTIFPNDGEDPQILFRNAHAASYRAKEMETQKYRFFTPNMDEEAMIMLRRETLLRTAIENDELSLNYQPVVDGQTGAMVGAEALIRWNNPELGFVPPDAFIPLAETTGLIVPIGEWVLETACRQAVQWQTEGSTPFTMAVNVSSRQFEGTKIVETIGRILGETGLSASCLEIEITERILIHDTALATIVLNEINSMGVSISIDDFGTGYSALSYLKQFPFDTLKVDRSFINDVTHDPDDAALVTAIVAMAHGLNHKVIAEGVETKDQWDFIRALNCDQIQGYFFGKPMPAEDFTAYWIEEKAKRLA